MTPSATVLAARFLSASESPLCLFVLWAMKVWSQMGIPVCCPGTSLVVVVVTSLLIVVVAVCVFSIVEFVVVVSAPALPLIALMLG